MYIKYPPIDAIKYYATAASFPAQGSNFAYDLSLNNLYFWDDATWVLIQTGTEVSAAWGTITGVLSNQTDLQAVLDLKAPLASPVFTTQITTPKIVAQTGIQLLIQVPDATIAPPIKILGGASNTNLNPSSMLIISGDNNGTGPASTLHLEGGFAGGSGKGGNVEIFGGESDSGTGGDVKLWAGPGDGGSNGSVQILDASGNLLLKGFDSTISLPILTASTVPYLDASKNLVSSAVTPTELGYVSGVTSSIQTQLNNKQSSIAGISFLDTPGSDSTISGTEPSSLTLQTQNNGSGASADLIIQAGTSNVAGSGGGILIQPGTNSAASGVGGTITVQAGTASNATGTGGTLNLNAGRATGGGTNGIINLKTANTTRLSISAAGVVNISGLTLSTVPYIDASKNLVSSAVTPTELGYLSGVTSAIQTQLNAKQASGNYITALTGDVTASGPGSVASTVAKIAGTTVSGTTGSTNVVFSASPTVTGTLTAATITASKAIVGGVSALTDGATPALDASLGNTFTLTTTTNPTIAVPSNPTSGQKITIAVLASGGSRTVSLNTGAGGFRFGTDITGLTATTSGKTDYIGAIYNAGSSFWDVVAYVKGF